MSATRSTNPVLLALDLQIRRRTEGARNLDDIIRAL
jgi:predicted metalloprotease with PDZ domain